jgi:PKD repeat protein
MKKVLITRAFFPLTLLVLLLVACGKNEPLTISFTPAQPTVGQDVQFTASQEGGGWKYTWTYGDGDNLVTDEPQVTHAYSVAGTYNVALSVEKNGNPYGNASTTVTVQ